VTSRSSQLLPSGSLNEAYAKYERTAPKHHWSGWYAAYMVARQQGKTPEEAAKQAALHMQQAH